jgi:hypothetical protein
MRSLGVTVPGLRVKALHQLLAIQNNPEFHYQSDVIDRYLSQLTGRRSAFR